MNKYNQRQPLVSIIIDNYNYGRFLGKAIDSALNQSYSPVEVIVVDDGSTDDSHHIMGTYGTKIISIVKKNRGQASCFNAGFEACKGSIICFLDSDDYFALDKIEKVVYLFETSGGIGWMFHRLEYVNGMEERLRIVEQTRFSVTTRVDFREMLNRGHRFPKFPYCTSGLCFRSGNLRKILPMPESIRITSDNFLKIAGATLSPGILCRKKLAYMRIHGGNAYSFRNDVRPLRAEIGVKTAYYLREKFDNIEKLTDRMFGSDFGKLVGEMGLASSLQVYEVSQYLKRYLSLKKWLSLLPRILFNTMKSICGKELRLWSRRRG